MYMCRLPGSGQHSKVRCSRKQYMYMCRLPGPDKKYPNAGTKKQYMYMCRLPEYILVSSYEENTK